LQAEDPLVSIIIPTYNRAHLIGETLDSVLAQTYTNWECIIVDDGSTDNTDEVVGAFVTKDHRFKYYHRPPEHLPGGNGARNFGFKMSQGEYVNWFDSDDLMTKNKLECQLNCIFKNNIDYCIDKYSNFSVQNEIMEERAFKKNDCSEINFRKYLMHQQYWGTVNFFGKKKILRDVYFNEVLKSGQEYNFFIGIHALNSNLKGFFIHNIGVLRRVHCESIQSLQRKNKDKRLQNKFNTYYTTYNCYCLHLNPIERHYLLMNALLYYHSLIIRNLPSGKLKQIIKLVYKEFKFTDFLKISVILYFSLIFKKGDVIGNQVIKKISNNYLNTKI
jgi:glycosyltransferase involved in cell wall biosynthesis